MEYVLRYNDNKYSFDVKNSEIITFLGNGSSVINNLMLKNKNNFITIEDNAINNKNIDILRNSVRFVDIDYIDIFNGETIMDELAFPLENQAMDKKTMKDKIESASKRFGFLKINTTAPLSLDVSSKVMLQIASSLIVEPKVLVLNNVLCLLNKDDKLLAFDIFSNFIKSGGVILNFTTDIEESLISNRIIVLGEDKILIEGETLGVLNEERIMKRLGYGLPFRILLSKYLKDYGLIDKYYLDNKSLGGALWK